MDIRIHVDPAWAEARVQGSVAAEDLVALVPDLLERPGFDPVLPVLLDFTGADFTGLTPADITRILTEARDLDGLGPRRTAFLAPADLSFWLVATFGDLAAVDGHERRAFRDRDAALGWLLQGA